MTEQEPGAAAQREGLDDATEREAAAHDEDARREHDRNQRVAEFNAHPHTQLTDILKGLQSRPTALDINGRVGALHSAVARLAQLMIGEFKPPVHPDSMEKVNEERRQDESARGS